MFVINDKHLIKSLNKAVRHFTMIQARDLPKYEEVIDIDKRKDELDKSDLPSYRNAIDTTLPNNQSQQQEQEVREPTRNTSNNLHEPQNSSKLTRFLMVLAIFFHCLFKSFCVFWLVSLELRYLRLNFTAVWGLFIK